MLNNTWCEGANLNLTPGKVLAIYTDDGPIGICGQCMSITSPHTYVYLFNSEDEFIENRSSLGRSGRNAKIRYTVIGDHSSEGVFELRHEI